MSYIELLEKLLNLVESDNIPTEDKAKISKQIQRLFELLYKYSD